MCSFHCIRKPVIGIYIPKQEVLPAIIPAVSNKPILPINNTMLIDVTHPISIVGGLRNDVSTSGTDC